MRRVIVSNLITLDGCLAAPDGDLSWFKVGPEFFRYVHGMLPEVGGLLFGRVTYAMMAQYWPSATAEKGDDPVIARLMNELPKWVFSRSLKEVSWGDYGTVRLSADPVAKVRELKAQPGKDLMIFGSGGLVSTLAPVGLIDEYRFIVNPTVLGRGIPMFRGFETRLPLKLSSTQVYDADVVMLTYISEKTG